MVKTEFEISSKPSYIEDQLIDRNRSKKGNERKSSNSSLKTKNSFVKRCIFPQTTSPARTTSKNNRRMHSVGEDSNDSDEDGGLKPKSYPTISKLIPSKQPILHSSPKVDVDDNDDDEEDGGVDVKKKLRRRQETTEAKQKIKQTRTSHFRISDDEDGGMSTLKTTKAEERKTKSDSKRTSKISTSAHDHTSDVDIVPVEKKKSSSPTDDDGGIKRTMPVKKTVKTNKGTKPIVQSDGEDDDQDEALFIPRQKSTYQTLTKQMSTNCEEFAMKSIVDENMDQIVPNESTTTIQSVVITMVVSKEQTPLPVEASSSSSGSKLSRPGQLHLIRRNSYTEAQENPSSGISEQSSPSPSCKSDDLLDQKLPQSPSSTSDPIVSTLERPSQEKTSRNNSSNLDTRTRARNRSELEKTLTNNPILLDTRRPGSNQTDHLTSQNGCPTANEKLISSNRTARNSETLSDKKQQTSMATNSSNNGNSHPTTVQRGLSAVTNKTYPSSPAEDYIATKAAMLTNPRSSLKSVPLVKSWSEGSSSPMDISPPNSSVFLPASPTSPSKDPLASSNGTNQTTFSSTSPSSPSPPSPISPNLSFEEHMRLWYKKEEMKRAKKHPHRYVYGPPPPRSLMPKNPPRKNSRSQSATKKPTARSSTGS